MEIKHSIIPVNNVNVVLYGKLLTYSLNFFYPNLDLTLFDQKYFLEKSNASNLSEEVGQALLRLHKNQQAQASDPRVRLRRLLILQKREQVHFRRDRYLAPEPFPLHALARIHDSRHLRIPGHPRASPCDPQPQVHARQVQNYRFRKKNPDVLGRLQKSRTDLRLRFPCHSHWVHYQHLWHSRGF